MTGVDCGGQEQNPAEREEDGKAKGIEPLDEKPERRRVLGKHGWPGFDSLPVHF
jgi:hypothetical protein